MMPPLLLGRRFTLPPPRRRVNAPPPDIPAREWWGHRRFRYNAGLVIAGALAVAVQVAVVSWGTSKGSLSPGPDPEATFKFVLDGVAYLFMMGIANVCYCLGPLSEEIIQPSNCNTHRRVTFLLGFWFSVLLPFSIPAQLAYFCLTVSSWRQLHG